MNLSLIQASLYQRAGFDTAPDPKVVSRFLGYINQTQREIMSSNVLGRLRRRVLPFSSIANLKFAVLPQAATRILSIYDPTNAILLDPISLADLRITDPALAASSGTPFYYVLMGMAAATARDPSVASQLSAKSTSAADGVTKELFVEGIRTGGYYGMTSILMNGVTAVDFLTIIDFITITKFYLTLAAGGSSSAAGTVTLHEGTGASGTELSRIPIGRSYPRYTQIQLYPTPTSALTYYADVELHIEDMVEANDEPYLPEDFHWLLVEGSLMKEFQWKTKPIQYAESKAVYKEGLSNLKLFVARMPGLSGKQNPRQFSQLGAMFPAGS